MTNYDSLPDMNPELAEEMRLFGRPEREHILGYMRLEEIYIPFKEAAGRVIEAGEPDGVTNYNMRFPNQPGVIPAIAAVFPEGTPDNARMRVYLSQPDADGSPPTRPVWSEGSRFRQRAEIEWGTWDEEVWENRVDLEPVSVNDSPAEPGSRNAAYLAERGIELQGTIDVDHATGAVSAAITAALGADAKQSLIQQAIDSLGDRTGEDPHGIAWHLLLAGRERGIEVETPTLLKIAEMMARGDEVKVDMIPDAP
ncbi:hypothetical protein ACSYDW_14595 [Paeniglutamicibacter sp. R2-26]|uniref:hypothetical protein n=1 Tax=Paeniglutamicibacter sp. R2-26 TaxID=3144417 RepID=UPI003EE5598D